jgi:heterodisulfide reductase subunit C
VGKLYEKLIQDYRIKEGLKACINCGTCTAICPAAEFYKYNPKNIVNIVQSQDDAKIEELLKGEQIWYCGECMSCVTRCPRRNAPGLVVMALRSLSIDLGYFVESEKGRQMLPLTRRMQSNILNYGYCVYPRTFLYKDHPEYGLTGKWVIENMEDVYERLGANLDGKGPGILRKIPDESLAELKAIFDETGATRRMEIIEEASKLKAKKMGIPYDEYERKAFEDTEKDHLNH